MNIIHAATRQQWQKIILQWPFEIATRTSGEGSNDNAVKTLSTT